MHNVRLVSHSLDLFLKPLKLRVRASFWLAQSLRCARSRITSVEEEKKTETAAAVAGATQGEPTDSSWEFSRSLPGFLGVFLCGDVTARQDPDLFIMTK